MTTIYPYMVQYRKRHLNTNKLREVRMNDTIKVVNGKPYYGPVRHIYFLSKENAQNAAQRLRKFDQGGYIKVKEGSFPVEEMKI